MTDQQASLPSGIAINELTNGDWLHLMVGFFWRGIVFTLGCALGGAVVGFVAGLILGAIMGIAGMPIETIQTAGGVLGFVLGLGVGFLGLRLYIQWILTSRFGSVRLSIHRVAAG